MCKIYFVCPSVSFQKGKKKFAGTVQLCNTTSVLANSVTNGRDYKHITWNITHEAGNTREVCTTTGMFCREIKFSIKTVWTWSIIKVPIHTNNCCVCSTKRSKCKHERPFQETYLPSIICSASSKSNSARGTKDNRLAQRSCWLTTSACIVQVYCSSFLPRRLILMMLTYEPDVLMINLSVLCIPFYYTHFHTLSCCCQKAETKIAKVQLRLLVLAYAFALPTLRLDWSDFTSCCLQGAPR